MNTILLLENIKPASAQKIARAMGEAEGNRLNDKMGGIILDGMGKEFSAVGNAVSSSENRGNTITHGDVEKVNATDGLVQRVRKDAIERLPKNATEKEIQAEMDKQLKVAKEEQSKLSPAENLVAITSDKIRNKKYNENSENKETKSEGNPGHSNWIKEDGLLNSAEDILDEGLDFVYDNLTAGVGSVMTAGLLYGAGRQVVKAGKKTKDGLFGGKTSSQSRKNPPNGTNSHNPKQQSDTASKSIKFHVDTPKENYDLAKENISNARQSKEDYSEKLKHGK